MLLLTAGKPCACRHDCCGQLLQTSMNSVFFNVFDGAGIDIQTILSYRTHRVTICNYNHTEGPFTSLRWLSKWWNECLEICQLRPRRCSHDAPKLNSCIDLITKIYKKENNRITCSMALCFWTLGGKLGQTSQTNMSCTCALSASRCLFRQRSCRPPFCKRSRLLDLGKGWQDNERYEVWNLEALLPWLCFCMRHVACSSPCTIRRY